jgi:hypothetical protein
LLVSGSDEELQESVDIVGKGVDDPTWAQDALHWTLNPYCPGTSIVRLDVPQVRSRDWRMT